MLGIFKKKNSSTKEFFDITEKDFLTHLKLCSQYSMTSTERMYALYSAVKYVVNNNIPGDFVECGVWKGGSSLMMALTLKEMGITDRKIILYDTFEGMSEPSDADIDLIGVTAQRQLNAADINDQNSVWCYSGLDEVKNNFTKAGIDLDQLQFVKGKVEGTIPSVLSEKIALLRLDTDWYESTKHEMIHLYPRLEKSGVLIIDDFGHWQGCRRAIEEYLQENNIHPMINRIDYTGRLIVKP